MIFRRLIIASNRQSFDPRITSSCFCHSSSPTVGHFTLITNTAFAYFVSHFTLAPSFELFNEHRDKMKCDRLTSLITKFEQSFGFRFHINLDLLLLQRQGLILSLNFVQRLVPHFGGTLCLLGISFVFVVSFCFFFSPLLKYNSIWNRNKNFIN